VGGSGRFYWEIYRRLPPADYAIAAGIYPNQDVVDRGHDLRVFRTPLNMPTWGILNVRNLRRYCRAVRGLWKIVKSEMPEQLHCARCLPEGLMGWWIHKWLGIPYFCYVWGEEVSVASGSRELAWLTRRALGNARFVITCSRNTERILVENWQVPAEHIRLLHPGVDIDRFIPAERNQGVRAALGWHDRPVVLTISRLQKSKGHDQMILALSAIRRVVPNVLYAVVGDGDQQDTLRQLVEREGLQNSVQFLGAIGMDDPRLIQCYQQCDLFVLPNRQVGLVLEGFGMVLVEAQACGRPVVGGTAGGTADTMSVPETGRLVDCEGPDQLAMVVSELLVDHARREQMGRAARRWVVENFDWDKLAKKAERLFLPPSTERGCAWAARSTGTFSSSRQR